MGIPKGAALMEIILSVETVRGKTKISFESGWQVWLRRDDIPDFPLKEGTAVDRECFLKHIRLHQYPAALDRAVRMLAGRPCSRKEIERRLKLARFDADVTELVLYKLEKENLLDDRDFAEQWVQSRSRKYGSARIHRELRMKGIDEETASGILDRISDEEQLLHAVDFAEKKIRSMQDSRDDRKLKHNVITSLVRRGYSWEIALKAFDEAFSRRD